MTEEEKDKAEKLSAQFMEEMRKEIQEHQDVILNLRAILATPSGRDFIRYLFKSLDVAEVPEFGLEGNLLMDRIGFLRAGHSIFKLVSEADSDKCADILAKVEKEKYATLHAKKIEQINGRSKT